MTKNPFKNKSSEEVLEMFIESPSEDTKKLNIYTVAIHTKTAEEVKDVISNVNDAIEKFTDIIGVYTEATDVSNRRMLYLTGALVFVGIVQIFF